MGIMYECIKFIFIKERNRFLNKFLLIFTDVCRSIISKVLTPWPNLHVTHLHTDTPPFLCLLLGDLLSQGIFSRTICTFPTYTCGFIRRRRDRWVWTVAIKNGPWPRQVANQLKLRTSRVTLSEVVSSDQPLSSSIYRYIFSRRAYSSGGRTDTRYH